MIILPEKWTLKQIDIMERSFDANLRHIRLHNIRLKLEANKYLSLYNRDFDQQSGEKTVRETMEGLIKNAFRISYVRSNFNEKNVNVARLNKVLKHDLNAHSLVIQGLEIDSSPNKFE